MSALGTRQLHTLLTDLDQSLGGLTNSAERDFLTIGDALSQSVAVFGRLANTFAELADHLHGEEANNAAASLERGINAIHQISRKDDQSGALLSDLENGAVDVAKRLGALQKIIAEVRSLAINAKIQASLVTATDVDFSVFTTTIGRLCRVADQATTQAATRLGAVHTAVASARVAMADFERNEAKELDAVHHRIETSLAKLSERREGVATAASAVSGKSQSIARRIATTVGELQINDSICQRLEHVRIALRFMASWLLSERTAVLGAEWLDEVPEERRLPLIVAVCRLQSEQLRGAVEDYRREVNSLIGNLSALANDARDILSGAEISFGGSDGELFVVEIEQGVKRAATLFAAYKTAHDRMRGVVGAVSSEFRAMAADLAAVQSIDTDMRIAGLNATLKCTRLSADGRALGVVAQELRGCSKRTEDSSRGIAQQLVQVLQFSERLSAAASIDEGAIGENPMEVMERSMAALSSLGRGMISALTDLRSDAGSVAARLTDTAASINIHQRIETGAKDTTERLAVISNSHDADVLIDETLRSYIHRLLRHYYTMDSERIIHHRFAGDEFIPAKVDIASDSSGDLDDCFL